MTFATMADFSPVAVVRNSRHLNTLLEVRAKLSKCLDSNDVGKLEHEVAELIKSPELEALSRIIEHSRSDWGSAIRRLLDPQRGSSVSLTNGNIAQRVAAVIAIIDDVLSAQINLILHHEEFRRLEGTWRGLDWLVHGTEISPILKTRVMNISKTELGHALKRSPGDAWDRNPVLQRLQDDGCCSPDEGPYSVLLGDYYFDHSREDLEMLARLAKVASAIHAPFIWETTK